MSASRRASGAVAEVLSKEGVVSLHSRCGRCVAAGHCAVDHIKARLPLIQPQLKVGSAASREVLRPPLDVEDAVGSSATYRCEYARRAIDQIQVVPIREDCVVVGSPWQAEVAEGRIRGRKLRIAVGRQIDHRKRLVVQRVREGQCNWCHLIIAMVTDVCRAWHDASAYLIYHVHANAGRGRWSWRRCKRSRWGGRRCWRCGSCCSRRWRRTACGRRRWRAAGSARRLDSNRHRRTCLEKADGGAGTSRRLICVEAKIVQRAITNRVGVLISRKGFGVPRYGIGELGNIPRCAAITLVVKCTVICPGGMLRRRMKCDVTNINSKA